MDLPETVSRLVERSSGLAERYAETGDTGALIEAVELARRALEGSRLTAGYGLVANDLANRLAEYYELTGDRASLDEAIALARQAVATTAFDEPDRAGRLNNLA